MIQRLTRQAVQVGDTTIGGDAPIVVQSMTNTETSNIEATVQQVAELAKAGSELVRVTVNDEASAMALPHIRERLAQLNLSVPLIGDFHFNGHRLVSAYPECVEALAKLRINPGNVGRGKKKDEQFTTIIDAACRYQKPIRIGVNWGSLDSAMLARLLDENAKSSTPRDLPKVMREAMVCSALESAQHAEQLGIAHNQIILSVKVSDVPNLVAVYTELAQRCDYALHLGLTEAGMGAKGIVASTTGISLLLAQGIGDTIRVSLTPEPKGSRTQEVIVAQEILQSLKLRSFTPSVVACPGCGRTSSVFFQELAAEIDTFLRTQMPLWRDLYAGVEEMKVAVMGCVVNGPGESKMANIGISLPGSGESPVAPVYIDGEKHVTLKGDQIAAEFKAIVVNYVQHKYAKHL